MKKDINFLPVEGIQVVVARKLTQLDQYDWHVYVINQNKQSIHNVFVTSSGYGEKDGEAQKTATLRHYFVEIQPRTYELVESIMPDVFHLNNEFWVSYYIDAQIYDKKFIFVPDSITESHLVNVPVLGLEGILHV